MTIHIDPDRCEGNAVCLALAPDVFDLDEHGRASVRPGASVTAHPDDVRRAVAGCPREALRLDEN